MLLVVDEYYGHVIDIGASSFWAHITRISDKEAYEAEFKLSAIPERFREELMLGSRFRWLIERDGTSHELLNRFEFDYGAPLTDVEIHAAKEKAKELLEYFRSREEDDSSRTNS